MRIIYLANIRLPTEKAHGLQIMKTCEALADAGAEVILCVPKGRYVKGEDPFKYYDVKENFRIRRLPSLGFSSVASEKAGFILAQISFALAVSGIRMCSDDIIYARDEYSLYPLSFYKKNLYFEAHDGRWNGFMKRVAHSCEGIISITQGLADFFTTHRIDANKITVIPDAVDIEAFKSNKPTGDIRKKLNLPLEAKIATYSGSLSIYSWKGVDVFLESLGHISDPLVRYMVVGGYEHEIGPLREKYPDPRIIFIGRVSPHEVPEYLYASDVLILPNKSGDPISEKFTSPMKLFEYMAAGKPIVASDLPSLREILNEKNSLIVPPNDSQALAAGIQKVFGDSALANTISKQASSDVGNYSWAKRAEQILRTVKYKFNSSNSSRNTEYYDKESVLYSQRRYPEKDTTYFHAFFKRRLSIVMDAIQKIHHLETSPAILEVGCADGIVLREIFDRFGSVFSSYKGIDISTGMIEAARKKHADTPITFDMRDPKGCFGGGKPQLILEVGVLNYANFDQDIECAAKELDPNGHYIISIAGRGSFWDKHRKSDTGFNNFRTYNEYETKIKEYFDIVEVKSVGIFIPGIWKIPVLARPIQSFWESLGDSLLKNKAHEKVYVLKVVSSSRKRGSTTQ